MGLYLSTRQLAERWNVRPQSIRVQRMRRQGPPYVKHGALVRYRISDVVAYEKAGRVRPDRSR